MNVVGIIQARMNSERLPKKVLLDICGVPVIEHVYKRALKTANINKIILATSVNDDDSSLADFARKRNFNLFRGSKDNVLERYYLCAKENSADIVVRFTGDNLLIDPEVNKVAVNCFLADQKYDYIKYGVNLPLGMQIEVFSFVSLEKSYLEAKEQICLEHVTPYIYKNKDKFKCAEIEHGVEDYSNLRWTMDTMHDFMLLNDIYSHFVEKKGLNSDGFGVKDVLEAYKIHPEWLEINKNVQQVKV